MSSNDAPIRVTAEQIEAAEAQDRDLPKLRRLLTGPTVFDASAGHAPAQAARTVDVADRIDRELAEARRTRAARDAHHAGRPVLMEPTLRNVLANPQEG